MATPKVLGDGRYYVNIGYLTDGSRTQPKFMLGRNAAQAVTRAALIEQLWERSQEIAREEQEPLVWHEVGLAIAKEIASGETTVFVKLEAGNAPDLAVGVLSGWQQPRPAGRGCGRNPRRFGSGSSSRVSASPPRSHERHGLEKACVHAILPTASVAIGSAVGSLLIGDLYVLFDARIIMINCEIGLPSPPVTSLPRLLRLHPFAVSFFVPTTVWPYSVSADDV